ncbi:hypothetical protein BIW11_04517, partial [Tropilaelaps mercedesae]
QPALDGAGEQLLSSAKCR